MDIGCDVCCLRAGWCDVRRLAAMCVAKERSAGRGKGAEADEPNESSRASIQRKGVAAVAAIVTGDVSRSVQRRRGMDYEGAVLKGRGWHRRSGWGVSNGHPERQR